MKIKLLLLSVVLVLTACESKTLKDTRYQMTKEVKDATYTYVNFEKFKEGRPCAEVNFNCLPESLDKSWQSKPLKDGLDTLDITSEVEKKYDLAIKASNKQYHEYMKKHPNATRKEIMLISSLDRDFFEKVDEKRFLVEMEESLEKEFPGFWREVKKPVRYRWLRRAMNKAKKFGDDPKQNNLMIELCARIGLDFDLDKKWKIITKFVAKDPRNHTAYAVDYIDYTVFNKTHDWTGTRITDWSMRRANGQLPSPKKPYPKLND